MKKTILSIALMLISYTGFCQVGIGTPSPLAGSMLDLTSTTKGFLPPRLTTADRNALKAPVQGLVIYNSTTKCIEFLRSDNKWYNLCDQTSVAVTAIGANTNTHSVGIGTTNPASSSYLDIVSITKGFLPPRMTPAQRNAINGGVFAEGLTIYNTSINCLEWWTGTAWTNGCGITTVATINCAGATVSGTVTQNTAATVTVTVPYTGGNGSAYATGSAIAATGVTGTLTATLQAGTASGAGNFTFNLAGTPTSTGTATFAFTFNGVSCSFNVTVSAMPPCPTPTGTLYGGGDVKINTSRIFNFSGTNYTSVSWAITPTTGVSTATGTGTTTGPITFSSLGGPYTVTFTATNTGGSCVTSTQTFNTAFNVITSPLNLNRCRITQTQSPTGDLINNTGYTGTVTVPYTVGDGSGYSATSITVNGLTLSRAAGTLLSGAGSIVYNLSGTYTGATGAGPTVFPINFFGVNLEITFKRDVLRNSLYYSSGAGSESLLAYDAAAVNDWIQISKTEFDDLPQSNTNNNCGPKNTTTAGSATEGGNSYLNGGGTFTLADQGGLYQTVIAPSELLYAVSWYNWNTNAIGEGYNTIYLTSVKINATAGQTISTPGPKLTKVGTASTGSYFVRKRPTFGSTGSMIYGSAGFTPNLTVGGSFYGSWPGNVDGFGHRPVRFGANGVPNQNYHGCLDSRTFWTGTANQW